MPQDSPSEDDENAHLLSGNLSLVNSEEDAAGHTAKEEQSSQWQTIWLSLSRARAWVFANVFGVITGIVLLVAVTVAVSIYYRDPLEFERDTLCLTPECVSAASGILENLSPSHEVINPCEDFARFACEGWDLKTDMSRDESYLSRFVQMTHRIQLSLRRTLQVSSSPWDTSSRPEIVDGVKSELFYKVQTAFNACMDTVSIEALGSSPLLFLLQELNEFYPANPPESAVPGLLERSPDDRTELSKTLGYLMSIGVDSLIAYKLDDDEKNTSVNVLRIMSPETPGLPSKEYYNDPEWVKDYKQTIRGVLNALYQEATPNYTHSNFGIMSDALVQSLVDFETRLAGATPSRKYAHDPSLYYNVFSITEIEALIPPIALQDLIEQQLPHYLPNKIIVESPDYLRVITRLLNESTRETIQAYFAWKMVQTHGPKVMSKALKPLLRLNNRLQSREAEAIEERWKTCVNHVDYGLSKLESSFRKIKLKLFAIKADEAYIAWITSKLFIDKTFSERDRAFGQAMLARIKDHYVQRLGDASWMSAEARELAIEKLHNLNAQFGYPIKSPKLDSFPELEEFYADVHLNVSTYFENAISMARNRMRHTAAMVGQPADHDRWRFPATVVDAYSHRLDVVIPAGIMQAPMFYNATVPRYLSYGALGSVIAHELTHSFDDLGRKFNQYGNYKDWWDKSTIQAFEQRAQCFADQFNNFTVPGPDGKPLHVDGRFSLGENIADTTGVIAAFSAWRHHEEQDPSQLLPGLQNFTREQLFFLNYAGTWCEKLRKEYQIWWIYNNPHSPGFARIVGVLANSKDFRQAYNCPRKEPTCEMW